MVSNTNGTNYDSAIYVFPNAAAGVTVINIDWTAAVQPFQYEVTEFYNVATTSPGAGSVSTANDTGTALTAGAFTPTDNDSTGGNLIWAYYSLSTNASDCPTNIAPGSGFTLLSADITGITNQEFPHACQYAIQTTSASINPTITFTNDTTNTYNCLAIALKAATAGTIPTGIRVETITLQSPASFSSSGGTLTAQFPTRGNLTAIIANEGDVVNITGITDSQSNTYTKRASTAGTPQCWHTTNSTPDTNLVITITIGNPNAGVRFTLMMHDIAGAGR